MKRRWFNAAVCLTAAAVFSGMAGAGAESCYGAGTIQAVPAKQAASAAAEPLMYGIGSTSKVITAAAVMRLADQGKIDLKEPLTTYIPEFEMADERYRAITAEMLLDHSSGLAGSTLENAMLLGDNDTQNHDKLLERLKTQRLKSDPGEIQVYCNDGFTLAEILVERVTGLMFTEYLNREFSLKLGLTQLKTPQSAGLAGKMAKIYDDQTGEELPTENANVIGSGGIYASATDLCRLSELFMRDRRESADILSDRALQAMETSRYNEEINPEGYDTTLSYGLGWDSVETYPYSRYGVKSLVKGGDTNYYHASLAVLPEENISCSVLTSGGSSTLNQLAVQEIVMTYLDEIGRIEREEDEEAVWAKETGVPVAEELVKRSGWYAGSDMLKVMVSSSGEMAVTSAGSGRKREQRYQYGGNGSFYSTDGSYISASGELSKGSGGRIGRTRLEFQTGKQGNEYLMAESLEVYPGLGRVATYLPVAARYSGNSPAGGAAASASASAAASASSSASAAASASSSASASSWKELSGQEYYIVSDKYTSGAWLKRFMVKPLILDKPEGILSFENLELKMAAVTDETHANFFTQVPGQAGRDLNDYERSEEDGKHYLTSGSYRYLAAADVKPLPEDSCEAVIGASGEAVWFTTGKMNQKHPVSIEKPENGAWYVYDHTGRDMKCVSSSWTLKEGRSFYLPEDGRIVFVGDAGAVFTIRYAE